MIFKTQQARVAAAVFQKHVNPPVRKKARSPVRPFNDAYALGLNDIFVTQGQ